MNDRQFKGLFTDNETILFSDNDPVKNRIMQKRGSKSEHHVNTYVDLPLNADYWEKSTPETSAGRRQRDNAVTALDDDGEAYGYDPYYKGLAQFSVHCETPMTIAIQGPWGSENRVR
ncbi:hypothetical protein [Corynebacterium falsenii]